MAEPVLVVAAAVGWVIRPDSFWPLLGSAALAVFPLGLTLRGRTSSLVWTTRLKRMAALSAGILFGATALVTWLVLSVTGRTPQGAATIVGTVLFYFALGRSALDRRPPGEAPVTEVCRPGVPYPRTRRTDGRGHHRQLREDIDQVVRVRSRGRHEASGRQSGELQQPLGAGAGGERPPHARRRGLHSRDGHLRARRDRRDVLVVAPIDSSADCHRTGPSAAVQDRATNPRGQIRDNRRGGRGGTQRRSSPSGDPGRKCGIRW